jgi:hypothetical protein
MVIARAQPTLLLAVVAAAQSRAVSPPAQSRSASPPSPILARNLGDVALTTATSYASLGTLGFVWSSTATAVRNVVGRGAHNVKPLAAGLQSARRLGQLSAGLSGGRALAQCLRGKDDNFCAVFSAVCGGAAAATSRVLLGLNPWTLPRAAKRPKDPGANIRWRCVCGWMLRVLQSRRNAELHRDVGRVHTRVRGPRARTTACRACRYGQGADGGAARCPRRGACEGEGRLCAAPSW